MKKRVISTLLMVCMLLGLLPATGFAASQSDAVRNAIISYISNYHGTFKSSYKGIAWGCFAFCNYVWSGVFGKDYYANMYTGVESTGFTNDIYGFLTQNNAKPGDILWCFDSKKAPAITHTMIILNFDSTGIWLSDGNSSGKLWHNNSKIEYNDRNYQKYFGGSCQLKLYKIYDSLWNAVSSNNIIIGMTNSDADTTPATLHLYLLEMLRRVYRLFQKSRQIMRSLLGAVE